MSLIADIADTLVAELNAASGGGGGAGAGGFSQSFQAERHYLPLFDLEQMKDLHVTVVPKGMTIQSSGRDRNQHDVQVDVAVQKRFTTGDNAELDPLLTLVEEIADFFRLRRLASVPAAVWVRTEHAPVYAPEHMEQMRQFTSVITLTYRVIR